MSEQTSNYMQQLDEWTQTTIIDPLGDVADELLYEEVIEHVKKAIRTKVLESYRNGQAAGPTKPRTGFPPRRQKTS